MLGKLWWPFCSGEQNWLGNFVKGPYKKHLCENNFELGPVVREMLFKDGSYLQL